VLSFTPTASAAREPLFSVAVGQVRVRYPRRYFGMGLQLIVDSNGYRLWFLTVRSAAGETIGPAADKQTIVTASTLNPKEFGPARAATRMWRGRCPPHELDLTAGMPGQRPRVERCPSSARCALARSLPKARLRRRDPARGLCETSGIG
jgi:hypothetical protein